MKVKNHFLKNFLLVGGLCLLIAGCGQRGGESRGKTSDGKEKVVEAGVFDAAKMKDQIVEVIQNSPKPKELINLINNTGASYILDVTIPVASSEKLLTSTKQSLGLGMYAFDLQYSNTYQRNDMTAKIAKVENDLVKKLGLDGELISSENFLERIKANSDNKDSVDFLVTQAINFSVQKLSSGQHPDVYALSFIGVNIEALHVLSQLTLLASNNAQLVALIDGQKDRVKSVFTLLEMMSGDEAVKPYYESMKPIAQFFQEKQNIGLAELNEIAPVIEKVRNSMIQ